MSFTTASAAERGSDGELNITFWQSPSTMNPYLSGGVKDTDAASLVLEPLAIYDDTGTLVPRLAEEIPSRENGGINEDYTEIIWKLRKDIFWSDGTPFTAEDVEFTGYYCLNPDGGCAQRSRFSDIQSFEVLDTHSIKITFQKPKFGPPMAFTSSSSPIIQQSQFKACIGFQSISCTEENASPIGTGPFVVKEFIPHSRAILEANPYYRDPDKPSFASLSITSSENSTSAAKSVLQSGEADYVWGLLLSPDEIKILQESELGIISTAFGTYVEQLSINLTNPSPELGQRRSTLDHPHPFLTDRRIRKALSLAIDRKQIAETGFGKNGLPTCNIISAPEHLVSNRNDTCINQDIVAARQLLDEAGWIIGPDGIRMKNGIRLSIQFQTSTNPVRQNTQALIKNWWSQIGIETIISDIDPSIFFGGDPESPDTYQKFFADVQMYANGFAGTDAESYLGTWKCGMHPKPENNWQGNNSQRYCNTNFDQLLSELSLTGEPFEREKITKTLNDIVVQEYIAIPLVHRGSVFAHSRTLGGIKLSNWDSELWNAADWFRIK